MSKPWKKGGADIGAWVSLGELVREVIPLEWKVAEAELRTTTYTKEDYCHTIFPNGLFKVDDSPKSASGSRRILVFNGKKGRVFVRNLWFLHMFFGMPKRVKKFLDGTPGERRTLFDLRMAELQVISSQYLRCFAAAPEVGKKLDAFSAVATDLYACVEAASASEAQTKAPQSGWGLGLADFIRQVEDRASYKAGAPEDACERALYFLELGRPDIAESIAREILDEYPDNPVALYTKAVLLVESSKRHSQEAFLHESLHDPSLTPVTAEEQWHCDRHGDAMLKAWQAAEESFQLLLRAWTNWPDNFKINAWRLQPKLWREEIEDVILNKAAIRCDPSRGGTMAGDVERVRERHDILGQLVRHVLKQREKYICKPLHVSALRNFVVVSASLWPEGGRKCLENLATAVTNDQDQPSVWWDELNGTELPIAEDATLSEALLGLGGDTLFCRAVFELLGPGEGLKLIEAIERKGENRRRDRDLAKRSLNLRKILAGKSPNLQGIADCLQICRHLVQNAHGPSTPLNASLMRWWRYTLVHSLFEASCLHAQSGDSKTAITGAEEALDLAKAWFADIGGDRAMVRFLEQDEYGETESIGDWLRGMPNIITNPESLDKSGPGPEWMREYSALPPKEFAAWAAQGHADGMPLLVAYCRWMSEKFGDEAVSLAEKVKELRSLTSRLS